MASLKGSDLYTLVASIANGFQMDSVLFYQLLSQVQGRIESQREWAILRKTDVSQSALTSDTFQTGKTMPADFFYWQTEKPLVLVDASNNNNYLFYKEIPISHQYEYQTISYRYACDYANSLLYLMGTVDRQYTIKQSYIYKPADIVAGTSWVFPSWCHPILAYDIAALYKKGIDYDEVNNAGADDNLRVRSELWQMMVSWDTRLQTQMTEGLNRTEDDDLAWTSGHVNMQDD